MIPENYVEQWRIQAPWQAISMVEQDLVISRALIELYNQPIVNKSLAFRGGTALHKLHLSSAARYSEDIDFVQIRAEPIGVTLNSIRKALDHWLGEPKRKLTERSAKLIYNYQSVDNIPAKLKVEINTTEHFNAMPIKEMVYSVNSEWFQGKTTIYTYELDELIATKLRALYQRRKGRDLFDLWLVLHNQLVNANNVLSIFSQYCEFNQFHITRALFEKNLKEKQLHNDFTSDMSILLNIENNYDMNAALELVVKELISKIK